MVKVKWDQSAQPSGPEDAVSNTAPKAKPNNPVNTGEKPYVHIPGTTHLNAYLADVEEAKAKVSSAQGELAAASQRLLEKKQESGMI